MRETNPYGTTILERGLKSNMSHDSSLANGEPAHVGERMVACIYRGSDACWGTHGDESKNEEVMMKGSEEMSGATQNGSNDEHNFCRIQSASHCASPTVLLFIVERV